MQCFDSLVRLSRHFSKSDIVTGSSWSKLPNLRSNDSSSCSALLIMPSSSSSDVSMSISIGEDERSRFGEPVRV
jgi:hypothetical protein